MVILRQKVTSCPRLQPQDTHLMITSSRLHFFKYSDSVLPSIKNFSGVRRFLQSDGTIKSKMPPASGNLIGIAKLVRPPTLLADINGHRRKEVGEGESVSWGGAQIKFEGHGCGITKNTFFHNYLLQLCLKKTRKITEFSPDTTVF